MYDSSSTLSHIDFMVFKYQSLGFIKEKKKKKDYLRQVWMLTTQIFFCHKMQTKNLAVAQNARILPASPLRLRHSNSSAIPKAQKKARTHTNTAWKQVLFSVWVELEHYAPTLLLK